MASKNIKSYLYTHKILTKETIMEWSEAYKTAADDKGSFGEYLVSNGVITDAVLARGMSDISGAPIVDLTSIRAQEELNIYINKSMASKYTMVPFKDDEHELHVAFAFPDNFIAIEAARSCAKKDIVVYTATIDSINRFIAIMYGRDTTDAAAAEIAQEVDLEDSSNLINTINVSGEDFTDSATIKYVNSLFNMAVQMKASDIHIEPNEKESVVRFRIDGVLKIVSKTASKSHAAVVATIKVASRLNVAEKRVPQDGRINIKSNGIYYDIRVSTVPTIYGEKVVMRLLQKSGGVIDKDTIGLHGKNIERYDKLLENHSGVILIVGPTGSGKSSTMFTMMKILNTPEVNIITLEDPVEYNINGVNQIQINEKTGMTFAAGLRAAMRQDPDIIMVGEIRDGETADISMRAAITGHLVVSTLHTSSAVGAFDRLTDMGVEPYVTASGLIGVISQRLVRKVCPKCRIEYEPTDEELQTIRVSREDVKNRLIYRHNPNGCPACNGTGYRGRTGIFEILIVTPEIKRIIASGGSSRDVEASLKPGELITMKDSCVELIMDGVTTIDEYKRTINSIE